MRECCEGAAARQHGERVTIPGPALAGEPEQAQGGSVCGLLSDQGYGLLSGRVLRRLAYQLLAAAQLVLDGFADKGAHPVSTDQRLDAPTNVFRQAHLCSSDVQRWPSHTGGTNRYRKVRQRSLLSGIGYCYKRYRLQSARTFLHGSAFACSKAAYWLMLNDEGSGGMRVNDQRDVFDRIEAKMRHIKWMLAVTIVLLLAILVGLP